MKRISAALLALLLMLSLFASCGKDTATGSTTLPPTTAEAPTTLPPEPTPLEPEPTEPAMTATETTEAATEATETTTDPAANKTAVIQLYNDATVKAYTTGQTFDKKVTTTVSMKGDEPTEKLLDTDILFWSIRSVVEKFLGSGTEENTGKAAKFWMQKSILKPEDVTSAEAVKNADGTTALTIRVKDCTNPQRVNSATTVVGENQGNSPMGRFTFDHIDKDYMNVNIGYAEKDVPGLKITIAEANMKYKNIVIKATLDKDGKLTGTLTHTWDYTATVDGIAVKFVVDLSTDGHATGTGHTVCTYKFL
ncbi:MAG: hypothetical protein LBR73_05385 [Oscillospiraceae bacterium]|jgi:hypothetical protein|nr:hypothetical protein [Oscillospiraceae bacterium]